MSILLIAGVSAVILLAAYFTYGPLLVRLLQLRDDVPTPAVTLRDDVDYEPIEAKFLLGQHFSAIAAAGPIVGPILAGIAFGWGPALIWILIGSVLIGGVHDFTALVASVRHKARSIAEIVRDHMSRRAYVLFLTFVWLALVYIIVAFTDVTASSFVGLQRLENDEIISGGGIAMSSLMYLVLPILMGLALRYTKMNLNVATCVFLPLVGVSIYAGQFLPLSVENMYGAPQAVADAGRVRDKLGTILDESQQQQLAAMKLADFELTRLVQPKSVTKPTGLVKELALNDTQIAAVHELLIDSTRHYNQAVVSAQTFWNVTLLIYCVVASLIPMWLLLQPRGHLGGYFLYVVLAAGFLGIVFGGKATQYPAFVGWYSEKGAPIFPLLFITIACGACSGFHSIIASGTTSKQLKKESDARVVGYGSMLLEAMVAIISLSCVMMLAQGSSVLSRSPSFIYANGVGEFLKVVNLPMALGVSFGLMAFTTFVYDTLDVCTRLGRYILQELFGLSGQVGRVGATLVTACVPMAFLFRPSVDPDTGTLIPAWRVFWELFGASNQLLAALTLIGVTVWLWRTYQKPWVFLVTGLPCVFMYTMSMWALLRFVEPIVMAVRGTTPWDTITGPVPWVATVLAILGLLILVEALIAILSQIPRPPAGQRQERAVPA